MYLYYISPPVLGEVWSKWVSWVEKLSAFVTGNIN